MIIARKFYFRNLVSFCKYFLCQIKLTTYVFTLAKKLDILEPIKSCIFSIKTYHVNILLSIKIKKKRDRHDNENIVEQVVVYRF